MDTEGVLGAQCLPMAGALGTLYLLDGGIWWAILAVGFAAASVWALTQSVVRHASWFWGDCLVQSDWDTAAHAGLSVATLGVLGLVQNDLGFLHGSIALVVLLLGASVGVAGLVEIRDNNEVAA